MEQVLGGILLAIGLLIALASGLCMGVVFSDSHTISSDDVTLVLIIGGVPFAVGVAMAIGGFFLLQAGRRP